MEGTWLDGAGAAWLDWMVRVSWQVTILAGVVFVIALAARKASPRFRYVLWSLVLVKLCLPPALAFVTGVGYWLPVDAALGDRRVSARAPLDSGDMPRIVEARSLLEPDASPATLTSPQRGRLEVAPGVSPEESSAINRVQAPEARLEVAPGASPGERGATNPTQAPEGRLRAATPSLATVKPPLTDGRPWPRVLFLAWLAGVAGMAALIVVQYGRLRRRLAGSVTVEDASVLAAFDDARRTLRVRARGRLFAAPGLTSPILVGLFRPRVVLPKGLLDGLDVRRLRPIFLHELAHLKRRDPWVNWVQVVLQTVYWFHPLVWLANLRLRRERELIVDDLVLVHLEGGHEMYGQSLLTVLRKAGKRRALAPGYVGIVETKGALARRLRRIADTDRKLRIRLGWASLAALVALALVLIPLAGPGLRAAGQTGQQEGRAPAAGPAEAATAPETPVGRPRTYRLKNGATLEILASTRLTDDALQWWDPEGRPTTVPGVVEADVDGHGTVVAFRVTGKDVAYVKVSLLEKSSIVRKEFWWVRAAGVRLVSLGDRRFVHLIFRVDEGPWQTAATVPITSADIGREIPGPEDSALQRLRDLKRLSEASFQIIVEYPGGHGPLTRLVALDKEGLHKEGTVVGHEMLGRSGKTYEATMRYTFPIEQLAGIRLQERTLETETVEVRNLRLVPDFKAVIVQTFRGSAPGAEEGKVQKPALPPSQPQLATARPEDIAAAEAQLKAARARLDVAADSLRRTEQLVKRNIVPKSNVLAARAEDAEAQARIAEAKAELARLKRAAKEAEKPLPVRFQAIVYRVKVPPERLSKLDVQSLARKSAGATAFKAGLAKFGPVDVLYHVDQVVDLSGPSQITVSERRPFVTNVRVSKTGTGLSTIRYENIGAIFRISEKARDAGRGQAAIGLTIELSDVGDSGVDIIRAAPAGMPRGTTGTTRPASRPAREGRLPVTRTRVTRGRRPPSLPAGGFKAQVVRQVTLVYNGLIQLGQPFAMLAAAPGPAEKDGAAVAYVARVVLKAEGEAKAPEVTVP